MWLEGLGAYSEYRGDLNNIEYMAKVYNCAEILFVSNGTSLFGYTFTFNAKGKVNGVFSATYFGFQVEWYSRATFMEPRRPRCGQHQTMRDSMKRIYPLHKAKTYS